VKQLTFSVPADPVDEVIAQHAQAWHEESARMVADALAHINRSCAQMLRHARIRCELERLRFLQHIDSNSTRGENDGRDG
jgi:hypothetical protein